MKQNYTRKAGRIMSYDENKPSDQMVVNITNEPMITGGA